MNPQMQALLIAAGLMFVPIAMGLCLIAAILIACKHPTKLPPRLRGPSAPSEK